MLEGYYGQEPFDLRLTVLLLFRYLKQILLITLAGTVLFGGWYYGKNVLWVNLTQAPQYTITTTYKIDYRDPPTKAGDYYINEATWNTYVASTEFTENVLTHLSQDGAVPELGELTPQQLAGMLAATVASDIQVPSVTVTADSSAHAAAICEAVRRTMTEDFPAGNEEVAAIRVIDEQPVPVLKERDVRCGRAFALSAVLSGFFAVAFFLLRELGNDRIELPAQIRTRYGIKCIGGMDEQGVQQEALVRENLLYLVGEKASGDRPVVSVCPVSEEQDIGAVTQTLAKLCGESVSATIQAVPSVMLCPEGCAALRKSDVVILATEAGNHVGKPLEQVLELLYTQDVKVDAALLVGADERLIRTYYRMGGRP